MTTLRPKQSGWCSTTANVAAIACDLELVETAPREWVHHRKGKR